MNNFTSLMSKVGGKTFFIIFYVVHSDIICLFYNHKIAVYFDGSQFIKSVFPGFRQYAVVYMFVYPIIQE